MATLTSNSKPITVSIVSHGHLELVLPLLAQLEAFSHASIEKVVLTLNIPEPDLLDGLRWKFPLQLIKNSTPKGYGANHNQAFQHCTTLWFLVLNPDIRLQCDALLPLIQEAQQSTGLTTPRIFEPGKQLPEPHRSVITPAEILGRKRKNYQPPRSPSWIPGLFMLFRTRAYAHINGFDERFFMYGEDFDICARLSLAGWQIQIGEKLQVIHDARRASHAALRHFCWHITSLIKVWTSQVFWRYWRQSKR